MEDHTSWTPSSEDNLQNLVDKDAINIQEAKGVALAELYVFGLHVEAPISTSLILDIHRIAFDHMYEWAGKWRTTNILVGQLEPPGHTRIIQLMYQFVDNINFKLSVATTREEHLDCLFYTHYQFICIHPFYNGNGRTGRILMNIIAMKFGYKPLSLYYREGESRKIYIEAMKAADKGQIDKLTGFIDNELTLF